MVRLGRVKESPEEGVGVSFASTVPASRDALLRLLIALCVAERDGGYIFNFVSSASFGVGKAILRKGDRAAGPT